MKEKEFNPEGFIAALPTAVRVQGEASTRNVKVNGKKIKPDASLKLVDHSPDGFNWGYGGSGPAQLALGLLLRFLPARLALDYYMDFKWQIVSKWPGGKDFDDTIDLKTIITNIHNHTPND